MTLFHLLISLPDSFRPDVGVYQCLPLVYQMKYLEC